MKGSKLLALWALSDNRDAAVTLAFLRDPRHGLGETLAVYRSGACCVVLQSAFAGSDSSVRRAECFMQASLISGEAQVVLYPTRLAANHCAETRLAETCARARHTRGAAEGCRLIGVRDQASRVLDET